ncbi:MAG: DUF2189 domain-containing protein [Chromatiaceae bacterium]|jgi:uncharacterized membrane protein|nr:DUF2189 domain-containing protein [Chromatiaceae bacterium]
MSTQTATTLTRGQAQALVIRSVDVAEPFDWLASGVRSFAAAPVASLLYGALFALAAAATLYWTWEMPGFTVALLTGLLLVGPVLAAGVYTAARQQERGEPVDIRAGLALLGHRSANLALFGVLLALIMAAWVRASALLFALKFNTLSITVEGYLGVLSGTGDPVALAYFVLIGLALAITVFITSAVAIPAILDRDCGPFTAIHASAQAFAQNWPAMLIWAALIVALTAIGIATAFVGMLVIFPVLGYATWHSYRRLVG